MFNLSTVQKKFAAAAIITSAIAASGYTALKSYTDTGINEAPIKFFFLESLDKPIQIALLPRELDIAIKRQDLERAEELLKAGANPNLTTHFTGPSLKDATNWAIDLDMMKLALKYGADVNQPDIAGGLPLNSIIAKHRDKNAVEAFKLMLSNCADPDLQASEHKNDTPRDWIEHFEANELKEILTKHEAENTHCIKPFVLGQP